MFEVEEVIREKKNWQEGRLWWGTLGQLNCEEIVKGRKFKTLVYHFYMESKKMIQMNLFTKQK